MGQAGRVPKESISILWGKEGEWHVIPNVPCEMVKGAHKEHTRKMRTLGARGTVVRNNGEAISWRRISFGRGKRGLGDLHSLVELFWGRVGYS